MYSKMGAAAVVATVVTGASAANCNYPGGECYQLAMQKCKKGDTHDTITLHGLWPQWQNTCDGAKFDMSILDPIKSDMEAKWLSCPEDGGDNEKFWSHEWEKHGTCSGMAQLDYFKKGLSMLDEHSKECSGSETCAICFDKDFIKEDTCTNGPAPAPGPGPAPSPGPGPAPSPGPSPEPADTCVPGKHGPKCKSDDDCKNIDGCVRCAHSGYCTHEPVELFLA